MNAPQFKRIIPAFSDAIHYFMPSASLMALALFVYSRTPFYNRFFSYLAGDIIFFGGLLYIFFGFAYSLWFSFKDPSKLGKRLAGDYFWTWVIELPRRGAAVLGALKSTRAIGALPSLFESEDARRTVLGIFVKAFFFPLMLQFFIANVRRTLVTAQAFHGFSWEMLPVTSRGFVFWISILLIVDTGIFMFAYIIEHRRLGNRLKSVDSTFGGWFVALICYPPFTSYFYRSLDQFAVAAVGGPGAPIAAGFELFPPALLQFSRAASFILFVIYVWASVALGWRSGNLINRGIVGRGIYRFVRHPAYAAKNLGWWFERLPYMTYASALVLLVTNVVYILRALTEERHLKKDPDYIEYCKKVRWRFIPGVI